jgi:hypothetical protein
LPGPTGDDDIPIGEVMAHAFRVDCERMVLRRLVLSMALGIPAPLLPEDERAALAEILDGG